METKTGDCPLGAKCEEVKEDKQTGNQVLYRCPWYSQVRGFNPNTNNETDSWGCAIAWMPMLMINAANEVRHGVAATEKFRNEMSRQNNVTHTLMLATAPLNPPASREGDQPILLEEKS